MRHEVVYFATGDFKTIDIGKGVQIKHILVEAFGADNIAVGTAMDWIIFYGNVQADVLYQRNFIALGSIKSDIADVDGNISTKFDKDYRDLREFEYINDDQHQITIYLSNLPATITLVRFTIITDRNT